MKIIPFLHSLIGFVVTVNNAINIRVFLTIIVIIIIVVIMEKEIFGFENCTMIFYTPQIGFVSARKFVLQIRST